MTLRISLSLVKAPLQHTEEILWRDEVDTCRQNHITKLFVLAEILER